jgi:hypothetical protein
MNAAGLALTEYEQPAERAPDAWPSMRAKFPGQALMRTINADTGEEHWMVLTGELADFHDGATAIVASPKRPLSPAEFDALVEECNRRRAEPLP